MLGGVGGARLAASLGKEKGAGCSLALFLVPAVAGLNLWSHLLVAEALLDHFHPSWQLMFH